MPKLVKAGALVALAWASAFAAVWLHVAWLLLPLIWLGVAGLLRAGVTLLDRLLLSALLGMGYFSVIGVALSVWPFGLGAAPITGCALTVIIVAWVISGRRFQLPRPRWSDAVPIGVAAVITAAVAAPYLRGGDFTGRLAALMSGQDSSRHASLVDQIRSSGTYSFMHPHVSSDILNPGMTDYPQGWHLLAAVLENFLTSSTKLGSGEQGLTLVMILLLATFGLLMLTLAWGAGRIVGRDSGMVTYTLTVCLAGWLAATSELVRTVVYGYPAEILCMIFLAALVTVAVRPATKVRDQIALLAAFTIGVGFSYYLFLPLALFIVFWAVITDRRRMKRVPFSMAVGALLCALAPMQAVAGIIVSRRDEQIALGKLGAVHPAELTIFALLVVAGVIAGWRTPVWRRYAPSAAAALLMAAAVYAYLRVTGHDPGYYFGKTLHIGVLLLVLGVGAAVELVRRLLGRVDGRIRFVGVTVVLAGLVLCQAAFGRPSLTAVPWFTAQVSGHMAHPDRAQIVVAVSEACPIEQGPPTVVFFGDVAENFGYVESIFLVALQRTSGEAYREAYGLPSSSPERRAEVLLQRAKQPVRVVIGDEMGKNAFAVTLRNHPELSGRATLIDLDTLRRSGECRPTGV